MPALCFPASPSRWRRCGRGERGSCGSTRRPVAVAAPITARVEATPALEPWIPRPCRHPARGPPGWLPGAPPAAPCPLAGGSHRRLRQLLPQSGDQAEGPLQILLFGSRARGDWDGYSDTDLLVVAPTRAEAERWADRLLEAGLAHDVVALDHPTWSGLDTSDSPHWRSVKSQAVPLLRHEP